MTLQEILGNIVGGTSCSGGRQTGINQLAITCSRTLLKFTEGCEDWQEWVDVRDALDTLKGEIDDKYTLSRISSVVADFDSRTEMRFPGFLAKRLAEVETRCTSI